MRRNAAKEVLLEKLKALGVEKSARRRLGAGLTQYEVEAVDTLGLIELSRKNRSSRQIVNQALAEGWPTIVDVLFKAKEEAQKLLKAHALPTSDDAVIVYKGDRWRRPKRGEAPRPRRKGYHNVVWERGLELAMRREDSPEWYAACILRAINDLSAAISQKEVGAVVHYSYQIGRLLERRMWKLYHEAPAMAGHAQTQKLKNISPKGTAAQKKKGRRNYSRVLKIAKKHCMAKPGLAQEPYKLADVVFRDNLTSIKPIIGNGGPLGLQAIYGHIRAAIRRGDLTK